MSSVLVRSLEIATADGTCDARFATPQGGPYPGVLFYMDAFGLRPAIDNMISRIALSGYAVLAPNLLYRSSGSPLLEDMTVLLNPENRPRVFERLMPMIKELTPDRLVQDAGAYLESLSRQPETAPGPVGVVGYCLGGAAAFRTGAAHPDRVAAVASFHGGNLATDAEDSPHGLAGRLAAEVYVGHADQDRSAPPEQQARLEEALTQAGVRHQAEVYVGAAHGFTMEDTAAYNAEATERHFERLLDLLGRTLRPQGM